MQEPQFTNTKESTPQQIQNICSEGKSDAANE